ncbi:acetylglutamate kinase [uncultured Tenacibaculum sp.]|uniref:acetylglutamate kinase n=1 Tax=uncultured Tenacibaculum sp. TaxID=174713 RepID=UPI002610811D|nr:acetylglutamate kinase [uncultured Tenacibaculum sp.]
MKIIKIGGNIINNQEALDSFLTNFHQIEGPKILVHGGGKLASELSNKLNIPVQMIDGRRITDTETLDIITMVYAGKINKNIVAKLQANQVNALGFTGADGQTILAKKRPSKPIDYGYAGDVVDVNISTLELLIKQHITPVFCAITHDTKGNLLNTNADTIASELAIAFGKYYRTELYYCFDKQGVLKDVQDSTSVIERMHFKEYQQLKKEQVIFEGMIPKLDNCFHALQNNVSQVHIGTTEMLFNTTTHTLLQLQ